MKKMRSLLSFVLITLFVGACMQSEFIEPVDNSTRLESNWLSKSEAASIAQKALYDLKTASQGTTRGVNGQPNILNIEIYQPTQTRTASNNNPFYIVNFEEGGFAILPIDKRATDVYALSEEGQINIEDIPENENFSYFMTLASEYLEEELGKLASVPRDSSGLIPVYDEDDPRNNPPIEHNGELCHCKEETTQTTPFYLLKTAWHQDQPYNHFCFANSGENAAAGCLPIAMAQIMAFHEKPVSYNGHSYDWDGITQFSTVSLTSAYIDDVAYLIHDIGVTASTDYNVEESSTNLSNAIETFHQFGYLQASLSGYNSNQICNSLDDSLPIILSGFRYDNVTNKEKGHSWVIDGYYQIRVTRTYYALGSATEIVDQESDTSTYLHCNWGWGLGFNAFCLNLVFKVGERHYDHDFSIINNIY